MQIRLRLKRPTRREPTMSHGPEKQREGGGGGGGGEGERQREERGERASKRETEFASRVEEQSFQRELNRGERGG